MGVIYKITNLVTEDIYVGSAMNLDKRKWCHLHHLRNNKHHSPILQNSWNKYGEGAFLFSVIEDVPDLTTLIQREQFWMDTLKPKFNCSPKAGALWVLNIPSRQGLT